MRLFHSRISRFVILPSQVSAIPVLGATVLPSSPFILGGSDARDVGCGMWAGWLAAPTEIRFPLARKSKHSQSAVCAAHPRSPTAALKPIWDAGWSKPRLPLLPPPLLSSTFCFESVLVSRFGAEEWGSAGENASLLSEIRLRISLERPGVFELAWRLADDRGRWSWWRVINKHFSRAGKRCRQASGHQPAVSSLAPLQDAKYKSSAPLQH